MPGLFAIRAADGTAFPLNQQDFHGITSLEQFRHHVLSPLLQIPPECIICMNEEGAQLRDDSLPLLAMLAANSQSNDAADDRAHPLPPSSSGPLHPSSDRDRRLFVFDRMLLDADPEEVCEKLYVYEEQLLTVPPLSPEEPVESHVQLSHHNLGTIYATIEAISLQRASLDLALSNLHRVNADNQGSVDHFQKESKEKIEGFSKLLQGWESAMEAIAKVPVIAGLTAKGHSRDGSAAAGMSGLGKERERYLGDYVSRDKMLAVKDGCAKVLADINTKAESMLAVLNGVLSGTEAVSEEFEASRRDLESLEALQNDAENSHIRVEELVRIGQDLTDPNLLTDCFEELTAIDAETRSRIKYLVEHKNGMSRYLVISMQRISSLQSDIADMPQRLAEVEHDLKTRTENFKHIARLEGLIPAYVATVVEVVRRREFSRLLEKHSQSVSQSIAHLSKMERTRRADYRTLHAGKLPWEVKGLGVGTDDLLPAFDLGDKLSLDDLPDLGREVLQGLRKTFNDMDDTDGPIRNARDLLDRLSKSIDTLLQEFAALELGEAPPITDPVVVEELEKQIRALEEANEGLERQLQSERSGVEEELAQLNQRNGELSAARERDAEALARLREQVTSNDLERKRWESDRATWSKEKRDSKDLLDEVTKRSLGAAEEVKATAIKLTDLQAQLDSAQIAMDLVKKSLAEVESQHSSLKTDYDNVTWELSRTKATISDLEGQVRAAETTNRELMASVADKDRLLRDHRGEAELDRAVLEKELADLRIAVEVKTREVATTQVRTSTLEDVAQGLREQIARWEIISVSKESEVGAAKGEAEAAKRERELGIVNAQRELVVATRTARAALKLAGELRDENSKITAALTSSIPSKSDSSSSDNPEKAALASASVGLSNSPPKEPSTASHLSPPLDYDAGDLGELLAEIEKYDRDALTEAVKGKIEALTSVSKKWSKEAKAYRERAHRATSGANDKIAFRNFAKGDLALFLPTRNSSVPVWAAFNVSSPHHFLAATGIISEQMKSREWIVARITNLTEKVADVKDPNSNPYQLAAGTKYFLLEVETWSSKEGGSRSRKHSSVDKGKSSRPEERRSSSTGHVRQSRSESSPGPPSTSPAQKTPLSSSSPSIRRTASTPIGLPSNATDLARSEFAIVEEDEANGPPSPTTLKQPVPKSTEPPVNPSALSLSLARGPPPTQTSASLNVKSDPFASGPFGASPPTGNDIVISPPQTAETAPEFKLASSSGVAEPAFLPSRKTSIGARSDAGSSASRYTLARSGPSVGKAKVELGTSPASTTGESFVNFPRSASSASSILSASMLHRRGASHVLGSSPPHAKSSSTTEAQEAGSRWATLTEDLNSATKDDLVPRKSMTIGRNSKGWPDVSNGGASSSGMLESFVSGRRSGSTSSTPPPPSSGSEAASQIIKRLKPQSSTESSKKAGLAGWGLNSPTK
ncbi:hypothetical protein T439DRAFT_326457 [Meredithblackwellia eburnea MCA 4105]